MSDLLRSLLHDSYVDFAIVLFIALCLFVSHFLHAVRKALKAVTFMVREFRHEWREVREAWNELKNELTGSTHAK